MGLFDDFIDIANEFKSVGNDIKKEFDDLKSDVASSVTDIRSGAKETASDVKNKVKNSVSMDGMLKPGKKNASQETKRPKDFDKSSDNVSEKG